MMNEGSQPPLASLRIKVHGYNMLQLVTNSHLAVDKHNILNLAKSVSVKHLHLRRGRWSCHDLQKRFDFHRFHSVCRTALSLSRTDHKYIHHIILHHYIHKLRILRLEIGLSELTPPKTHDNFHLKAVFSSSFIAQGPLALGKG